MELLKKKPKQDAEPQIEFVVNDPVAPVEPTESKLPLTLRKAKTPKAPKEPKKPKNEKKAKKAKKEPAKKDPNAPAAKSLATMDIKDLVALMKKKSSKKGLISESKRTMNFVHYQKDFNLVKVLPAALIVIIAVAVFAKVGFLDQIDQKTRAYNDLAAKQEKLASINAYLTGYDEVATEYDRYNYNWMTEAETSLVDRIAIMNLVEEMIYPYGITDNITINNNILTLNLRGLTLEETSEMVQELETSPMVQSATVYSASAATDGEASIFISINLVKAAPIAEEEQS